ncbi:carbon-nitrogen hydrolase family protein [Emticicia sp. 21SJ11W-3]|uniref:carbon-nitrogen hydrolase family protein n=1 Tax=Emticicia sp. 21SJ11W-3 TaxID=2916755 RepID=UPI0020A14B2C|nr:carbon-nitrogen hydrolase family protein [Emticicia sp. 21SJ11W-3]UTA68166.1 carbon-nitrogen hydrolase family protein [Emticicia sp. 21SJ11W-3]
MKTTRKILLSAGSVLVSLLTFYLVWANTGLGSETKQSLKIDATASYGDSSNKGNVVGIQAFVEPVDYASEANFRRKIRFYMEEAKKKNWLIPNKSIVVFPEYFGTWLVALQEKERIYSTPEIEEGMQTMVLRNAGRFLATFLKCPPNVQDKLKYSVFAMKAEVIARVYQDTFASLAKEYKVTIVGGSVLLPDPVVENGLLKTRGGLLYNTSVVFETDGTINPQLIKKAFPTADELGFICPVKPEAIPVFNTGAGKMGVLICADAWFSEAYQTLKSKSADFVITPSYSNGYGYWQQPWSGYSGAKTPEKAKADVGKISLGEAWVKYAMATRAKEEAGIKKGINVFLQGKLWNLGADGSTIVLSDSAHATPFVGKSALINLWL